ncbi:MAG: aminotransferase class V-fold PLP-dependent enzyme [Betaproteobacteria bacterium]
MIYLDNASTSWPKPETVYRTMMRFARHTGASPGRGSYEKALEAARVVMETRSDLAKLLGVKEPERLVFTHNATEALNIAILGSLKPGDTVLVSDIEHNAVMRPLNAVRREWDLRIVEVGTDDEGRVDLDKLRRALEDWPKARLLITCYASNVIGTIQPVAEIGRLARAAGVTYLVDAAQAVGHLPIDLSALPVDLFAFSGHKGLMGPPGTGGLYVGPGQMPEPRIYGGTGSKSEDTHQPYFLPDYYESGTINGWGIAGLGAGVRWVRKQKVERIRQHELALVQRLIDGISEVFDLVVHGPKDINQRVGLVTITVGYLPGADAAYILDRAHQIACRGGLHCNPQAHHRIGSLPYGAVRFSPGPFTTEEEIDRTVKALIQLAAEARVAQVYF